MSTVGVGSFLFLQAKIISSFVAFPSSTLEYAFTETQGQNFTAYLLTGYFLLRGSHSDKAIIVFAFWNSLEDNANLRGDENT